MLRIMAAWLFLFLAGTWTLTPASGPAIGIATAQGSFLVDHARISGNSTLFEGATVETEEASSRLQLTHGPRVELAAASRAIVHDRRLMLEKGGTEVAGATDYEVEARTLRIRPADRRSVARVRLDGDRVVLVAAAGGPVRVYNRIGLLVANVKPEMALRFEPQAAPENSFKMAGCLLRKQGKFVLADETGSQVVELQGMDFAPQLGNRVQVSGTALPGVTPVEGASQAIQVQTIEQVAPGGCLGIANQIGAETPTVAAPGPVEKTSHTGAIIAGVAVAGAGGGIAAAVCCKGSKTLASPQ
jgi:hypothetical protein